MLRIKVPVSLLFSLLFSASTPAMAVRGLFSDMPANTAASDPVYQTQGIHGQVRGMFSDMPANTAASDPVYQTQGIHGQVRETGANSRQNNWNYGQQWREGDEPERQWERQWSTEREPDGRWERQWSTEREPDGHWERQWSYKWRIQGDNEPGGNLANDQSMPGSGGSNGPGNWTPTVYQLQHGYGALPPTTTSPLSLNICDERQLADMREKSFADNWAEFGPPPGYERRWWWVDEHPWF